ncbi:glycosyltransferase family 4 protein [Phyllobacterium phragmitis]|uniref:Glycosyltransferase family 4 protein n=1 Tax=Phyllobacterium phragmitis TaxID=2670329 RepID=A0ABQ0GW01_9HYPH
MRLAYFARPHIGGTYSVFKQLRHGLAPCGIDVRWLTTGNTDVETDERWRTELGIGDALDPQGRLGERERAKLLMNFIEKSGIDGVFVNVLADRLETNIVRYLPPHVLRFMIVHTITPATYAAAAAIRDHVHATIGVSQRCRSDLISRFSFPPERTVAIANAVDFTDMNISRYGAPPRGSLRLLFLGRIDDISKGVFWLPHIMKHLPSPVTLTIAGDGPDLPKLRRRFTADTRVSFAGGVAHEKVRALLAAHDVLIMPSRFEGAPMSLVEAMAEGCVPIVSRIRNVTDTIVDHGVNGMLFPVGDWRKAAQHIETLRNNPGLLGAMSHAARFKAESGFTAEKMAASYATLIMAVKADPPVLAAILPIEEWTLPAGLRASLRTYLPQPVKNWLRLVRERLNTATPV